MKIVVTSPSFSLNETLRNELQAAFSDCVLNKEGRRLSGQGLLDFLKDANGVVIGLEVLSADIVHRLPDLKIVSKFGVGVDNIDIECCEECGIKIGWTPGVNRVSVAEMTLAFMIMLVRNIYTTSLQLKDGVWNKSGGSNLQGKTVGIIGVGNVAKELCRLLKPFHCTILVNDIIDQTAYYRENGLRETSKEDIYREADLVSLHTPLTELTRNLINREVLSKMKNSAYLVNSARGSIVNSADLKWALKNGVIAGAATDVYDEEPPADRELIDLPNLICTPHIGGNSVESVLAMGRSAIGHLKTFFGR